MKFITIFLSAAALAQNQIIIKRKDGSSNAIDATPGACRGLGGDFISRISVPAGLVAQFFSDYNCQGNQVAFAIRNDFNPTGNPGTAKSVRVLNERGPSPNDAAYYHHNDDYGYSDHSEAPYPEGDYYNSIFDHLNNRYKPNFYRSPAHRNYNQIPPKH